jgi:hypothetical protein
MAAHAAGGASDDPGTDDTGGHDNEPQADVGLLPVRRRARKPLKPASEPHVPSPAPPQPAQPQAAAAAPPLRRAPRRSHGADDADDEDYDPRRPAGRSGSGSGGSHQDKGAAAAAARRAGAGAQSPAGSGRAGAASPARGAGRAASASIGSRLLSQRAVAPKGAATAAPAGASGYFGVSWSKNKQRWDACFRACDVKLFRRNYYTPDEAARAWDLAARECGAWGHGRGAHAAASGGRGRGVCAPRLSQAPVAQDLAPASRWQPCFRSERGACVHGHP